MFGRKLQFKEERAITTIKFEKPIFLEDNFKIIFNKFQAAVGLAAQSMKTKFPHKENAYMKINSWPFRFISDLY